MSGNSTTKLSWTLPQPVEARHLIGSPHMDKATTQKPLVERLREGAGLDTQHEAAEEITRMRAVLHLFANKAGTVSESRIDDFTVGVPVGWLRDARAVLGYSR